MSHSYGRIFFILLGVGIAVYACWKITQRVDGFLYPWADTRSGKPLLVGSWVGHGNSVDGRQFAVMLELQRWRPERASDCSGCDTLRGSASTCNAAGQESYGVSGKPADRKATHFSLQAQPLVGESAVRSQLQALRGAWQVNDLTLDVDWRQPDAPTPVSGAVKADADLHLTMQREGTDAFQLLCERISRGISQ